MTVTAAQLDAVTTVHAERSVSVHKINAITSKHKIRMNDSHAMREEHMNQLVSLKSEVNLEQNNIPKVVSAMVREFQAETVAMKLDKNAKLLDMVVKQRTLKTSHASELVDKNNTITTVKRASRETVEREAKLTKDVRVATEISNSNRKLVQDRKKKAYGMARNVQYLKDELEDSRDKAKCFQAEVVNLLGLKPFVELS